MKKKTILIVEDSLVNRKLLIKILQADYVFLEAANGQEALELLAQSSEKISLILLDIVMPIMDGYSFLMEQQRREDYSKIPVIVLSQSIGEEEEVRSLSSGALDFLRKPYNPEIIKYRVANTIKLRETAGAINIRGKDLLTGIYNKDFFYKKAAQIINDNPTKVYDIICSDIERFKLTNDILGVELGDEILRIYAGILTEKVANCGICGRIGGDQFGMLIEHREEYHTEFFVEMINQLNASFKDLQLNLRYGVFTAWNRTLPVHVMCDRANIAVNSIKGRYGVYFAIYDDKKRQKMLEEQFIVENMQQALADGQFQVYYQTKVELLTNQVIGAEALVRWIKPDGSVLPPDRFIPLFEHNGFITTLDMYVWEEVCLWLRRWIDQGNEPLAISVNVSRHDIYKTELPKVFMSLVQKYNLEAKYLHLEITESAYTDNPDQIIATVTQLKQLGFIIEMDDFGTGYSSLNMLSELPIDLLKLDMQFIHKETSKKNDRGVLGFVISLAKWLNLKVVAEGIETEEQKKILQSFACDYGQGYYYSKPLPQSEFETLLASSVLLDTTKKTPIVCVPLAQNAGSKGVMLLVDDSALNRTILKTYFECSYDIIEVSNGQEALSYLKKNFAKVKVIILDLLMPILDGFQTLEILQADERLRDIPVIATSQFASGLEERVFGLGAVEYLPKPYSPQIAMKRVQNVVSLHEAQLRAGKELS